MSDSAQQFLRKSVLLVSNAAGQALDLSQLRIKFSVKKSGVMTPNTGEFRVYNLSDETVALIKKEFSQVTFQAGYEANFGVIFKGTIKQTISGRENSTDTFLDIIAGDGDEAYNFAIVNVTLAAGSSTSSQLNAAIAPMGKFGVTPGFVGPLTPNQLPRGKTMYGNAKEHVRLIADTNDFNWSIQDEQVYFIKSSTYLPGEVVVLNSKTGMIGTPQQTIEGIKCKCLLNPQLKIHGRAQLDNATVAQYKIDFLQPGSAANTPVPLTADGVYYILVAEHEGDTRDVPWYTSLVLLNIDPSSNPLNSVKAGN